MKAAGALLLIALLANFFVDIHGHDCDFNDDCTETCKQNCIPDTVPFCFVHECYCGIVSQRPSLHSHSRPVPVNI